MKTGTNAHLPAKAGLSLCPALSSYLEAPRGPYVPGTVLLNTTNTDLEKMWAFSSGKSLSRRRKNAHHKTSGRRGCISNDPKMERGLEPALEGSIDTANAGKWNPVWLFTALKV